MLLELFSPLLMGFFQYTHAFLGLVEWLRVLLVGGVSGLLLLCLGAGDV